jgi:hypothetical protein
MEKFPGGIAEIEKRLPFVRDEKPVVIADF